MRGVFTLVKWTGCMVSFRCYPVFPSAIYVILSLCASRCCCLCDR